MAEIKTIMSVGGHIGDVENATGGLLATKALQGWRVISVALTYGEKGNPPHITPQDYKKQKIWEANNFAELMGNGSKAVLYPCEDGKLLVNEEAKWWMADVIREYKPEILLTHWGKSMHKDHIATHQIVKDAVFFAAIPAFQRENPPHGVGGVYYAENWEDPEDFDRAVYFEVSREGFELWQKAVRNHWFIMNSPSFRYFDYYSHLMALRGIEIRKEYAEAYNIEAYSKRVVKPLG